MHNPYFDEQAAQCLQADDIDKELYTDYGVKRGLRDRSGRGVLTGLTRISRIDSTVERDGVRYPCEGRLWYRGYDVQELVSHRSNRGFEEIAYLLLLGELPNAEQLHSFTEQLTRLRRLPVNFTRDVIMKAPGRDLMNSLTKSVLTLASYDDNMADNSVSNVLRQSMRLISVFPMLTVYAYHAFNHYKNDESMYIHRPLKTLSTAENILYMLRADKGYTKLEADVLDAALILHMEHGGGNNSTFTTRVVTSSGSDTYSVVAAALSSLKGPKHGGANIKVVEMMRDIRDNVSDCHDQEELRRYLERILEKNAFDRSGLIYGMGHAVYSLSDPRAQVFKGFVEKLAREKNRMEDYYLYTAVEAAAPQIINARRQIYKGVSANVDFYSGFVYSMLNIPTELFTPIFAIARIVGWSAHRIEELINMDKIIRPAYQSVMDIRSYTPMQDRK